MNLTASPQINLSKDSNDSDDETGTNSKGSSNTGEFSADIRDHVVGLSAEQKFKTIVENAESLAQICKGLTFSLPLAQLHNALQWEKNLVKFYPMLNGWDTKKEFPTFGKMLYIQGLKNVKDMKMKELEEKLVKVEDDLDEKLKRAHKRWTSISSDDRAMKVLSLSAALAWVSSQYTYGQGTILTSAADCTMFREGEAEPENATSPETATYPEPATALEALQGVAVPTYPDGKIVSPIGEIVDSNTTENGLEDEKQEQRSLDTSNVNQTPNAQWVK